MTTRASSRWPTSRAGGSAPASRGGASPRTRPPCDEPATEARRGSTRRPSEPGQLAAAERERDEYLELARRTQADFENYRKRAAPRPRRRERAGGRASSRAAAGARQPRARARGGQADGRDSRPHAEGVALVH